MVLSGQESAVCAIFMGNSNGHERVIISVGGSLIVPNEGIATAFLTRLNDFVRNQLAQNPKRQFFLVIGGGATARHYIDAGREVVGHELTNEDLDWLGIHATRLNAHLVRTIFQDIAHPQIIEHYEVIRKAEEPVVVASGWKPGWSTDYCATLLCEDYDVRSFINLSNITQLFDRDPKEFKDAKPIDNITWADLRKIIGDDWTPGLHAPFDPIAAKKAQILGIKVAIMSGSDLGNVKNFLEDKKFVGTIVE
jgi:uridylate kinase